MDVFEEKKLAKADIVLLALGKHFEDLVENFRDNGNETRGNSTLWDEAENGDDNPHYATEPAPCRELLLFCDDESVSKMDAVPQEIRERLDARWKADWVEGYREFATGWNGNPENGEKVPEVELGADFERAVAKVYERMHDEDEPLSAMDEFMLEWFGTEMCMFRFSSRLVDDRNVEFRIGLNTHGDDFPGMHTETIHSFTMSLKDVAALERKMEKDAMADEEFAEKIYDDMVGRNAVAKPKPEVF